MPCILWSRVRMAVMWLIFHTDHSAVLGNDVKELSKHVNDISVEARFAASNMINVTIQAPATDPSKSAAYFVLTERGRSDSLEHRAVSHHSNHQQLSTTTLLYSLWLSAESFSAHVQLAVDLTLNSKLHRFTRSVPVYRSPDMRPPRISHLVWNNFDADNVKLCSGLNLSCSTAPPPVYVIDGDQPTISCVIDRMTTVRPLHIEWLRDGKVHSNHTYTDIGDVNYTITVASNANYVYQCKATTKYGTSTSHIATVYTIDFNRPHVEDQSYERPKDSFVTIHCNRSEVTSHTPRGSVRVTWKKDDQPLTSDRRVVSVEEEGVLIIRDLVETDAGQYECRVYNAKRGMEVPINKAHLAVSASSIPADVVEVYGQAVHVGTVAGEPLTLHCIFSSSDDVVWAVPDDFGPPHLKDMNTALHFSRVTLAMNEQRVTCRTSSSSATKTFVISVIERPVISLSSSMVSVNVGETLEVNCDVNVRPTPDILWYRNDKQVSLIGSYFAKNDVTKDDNGEVLCKVATDVGGAMAAASVFVYDRTQIVLHSVEPGDGRLHLHCLANTDTYTPLNVTWIARNLKSGEIETLSDVTGNDIILANDSLSVSTALVNRYNFTCVASNGYSTSRHTFHDLTRHVQQPRVGNSSQSKSTWADISPLLLMVTISSAVVVIFVILGITVFKSCKVYSKSNQSETRSHRTNSRLNSYLEESVQENLLIQRHQAPMYDHNRNAHKVRKSSCLANDPDLMTLIMEVYVDRPRIVVQELIGKGQFGRVYKGILRDTADLTCGPIAIKTLKYKSNETEMVDLFLREAVIMKNFNHENVLRLIGISVESDDSPMVVLPYMSRGDLRGYILKESTEITVLDLLKLGLQAARGMAYLCVQKFIHRDLACRNCMIDENSVVKVADFGLSRDLFSRDYYRDSPGKHPLPVRWMAPECHKNSVFTMQSDVWSFGVLLWELMTRGLTPFYEVENWQVPAHVMSGASLAQPEYCPDSVYEVMVGCWYREPQARSKFSEIVQQIEDIILTARTGTMYDSERFYHNIQRPEETDYRDSGSTMTSPF